MSYRAYARLASVRHYIAQHRSVAELGIGPADLVVDLGSGQSPHPRANVLCDKYIGDNIERANHADVRVDRPLVVADATHTPFVTHSFDFAFCAQLLEHMADPAALLQELQRIARAGYIETPSKVYEKLYGWNFHRWFVSLEGDRLVLQAKDRPIYDGDLNAWFRKNLDRPSFWRTFIPRLREHDLLTVLVWRGGIAYEIIGETSTYGDDAADFTAAELPADPAHTAKPGTSTVPQRVKSRLDAILRRRSDARVNEILEQLECVACRSSLSRSRAELRCEACGARYDRRDEIHVLLAPPGESAGVASEGLRGASNSS